MSIIERPRQTVKPAARRRFAEGLIEPGVDVKKVRAMMLGLGTSLGERMVMEHAWKERAGSEEACAERALAALESLRVRFEPAGPGWQRSRTRPVELPVYEASIEDRTWFSSEGDLESRENEARWREYEEWQAIVEQAQPDLESSHEEMTQMGAWGGHDLD